MARLAGLQILLFMSWLFQHSAYNKNKFAKSLRVSHLRESSLLRPHNNNENISIGYWRKIGLTNKVIQCLLLVLATMFQGVALAQTDNHRYDLDIDGGMLGTALGKLARDTGLQLIYSHEFAESVSSKPVVGSYTVSDALSVMLANTGLSGGLTRNGVIVISLIRSQREVMQNRNTSKTLFASLAAFILGSGGVEAQETTGSPEVKRSTTIEEVIVTARKREESLMETPVSITAFSGEDLVNRNITSIDQIGDQTPGLVFSSSANISGSSNAAAVFIRGIGQSDYTLAVEPGVGIYIDDVYLPHSIGNVANVVDIERIEVLRGPQGTLFGRNTIGGAIRIVTTKPSNEYEGDIEFTLGEYDRIDIKGHANIPLSDTFFVRVSGLSQDRDGFVDRPFLTEDSGNKDTVNLIAQARWLASDNLTADLAIGIDRDDSAGAPMVAIFQDPEHPAGTQAQRFRDFIAPFVDPAVLQGMLQGAVSAAINDPDGRCCVSFSDTVIPSRTRGQNATLTLNWDVNENMSLKSITAYRDLDSQFGRDADNLPFNQQVELFLSVDYDVWSQELQLSGTSLQDRLDWTVGAYYFKEEGVEDDIVAFASFDITSGGFFETEDFALFAQGTYDLTDKLSLTAGVRYTDEEKTAEVDGDRHQGLQTGFLSSLDAQGSKANTNFGPGLPFALVPPGTYVEAVKETVPYINLSYQATDDLMVYGSYSEGFKGGGIQVRNGPLPFLPQFDPETVESFEFGVKWTGLDGRMNVSAAVFSMTYDDVQLPGSVFQEDLGNAVSLVDNLGDAKNSGFELEITALPMPNLRISAGVAYLDSEYDSVKDNEAADALDPNSAITNDDELPNTPEWQFNASVSYDIETAHGMYTPRVDVGYTDEQFNDAINTELLKRDAYTNLNLSLGFVSEDEKWSGSLFVQNALDEQVIVAGFNGFNYMDGAISRPREWGLRIRRSF